MAVDPSTVRMRLYDWCSIAQLNAERMWESYQAWHEALLEHGLYANWVSEGRPAVWAKVARSWRKRVTFGMVWQFNRDVQGFVHAAAQVQKCVNLLGADQFPKPPDGPSITSVRNFEEHWENPYQPTLDAVRSVLASNIEPGMVAAVSQDLYVGNLSMGAVDAWIKRVKKVAAKQLRENGRTPPTARMHLPGIPRD